MKHSLSVLAATGLLVTLGACTETAVSPDAVDNELSLSSASGSSNGNSFVARLDGSQEVPPATTSGSGLATFRASASSNRLLYRLFAANLEDVTQAHIHIGEAGTNGPVVAFLFGPSDGISPDGRVAGGELTDDDVIERDGFDGTVAALIERLASGGAYVNVHSISVPSGEIRGQIGMTPPDTKHYLIRLRNRTRSQPFSPGVVVTHGEDVHVFRGGEPASEGIRLIAENGDPSTAVSELLGMPGVHDVQATPRPVGCQGCEGPFPHWLTMFVEATYESHLSVAVMAICTNDGFPGIRTKLPNGFGIRRRLAIAYDAGTEANDELFTSIVDPCGGIGPAPVAGDGLNDRTATTDVVEEHDGITGAGDLAPDVYGWRGAPMRVVMQRLQ